MDQEPCLMQVLCILVCPTLGRFITGGYLSSLDAISFRRFLLAVMPREINRSCFLMFVQSVMMMLFQNVSVPQVLRVLLTKCFLLLYLPLSIGFWKTSGSNLMSPGKSRSSQHLTFQPLGLMLLVQFSLTCLLHSLFSTARNGYRNQKWVTLRR